MAQLTTNPAQTARRIQRLARSLHLPLRDLAPLFGVSYQSIKWWSSGRHAPSLKHQRVLEVLERRNIARILELEALDDGDLAAYYQSLLSHQKEQEVPLR